MEKFSTKTKAFIFSERSMVDRGEGRAWGGRGMKKEEHGEKVSRKRRVQREVNGERGARGGEKERQGGVEKRRVQRAR